MFTKSWLSWFWQSGLVGLLTLMGVGEGAFGGVESKTLAQSNQTSSVGTVVTVNGNVFEITGGTTVGVQTGAVGNGGHITLQTGSVSLFGGGQLNANMFGQGKAGNISIQATDAVSLRNAFVFSNLGPGGEGQGGDIRLSARSLSLTDGTQLVASSGGRGNAGNIFCLMENLF
ncbi:hypothetical protein WA1_35285 [Scytonema hofmannii PCC 7110]|uniref:Filamentous haemagglutinin FhaB/tRNA nuclease CdiA-like TPS domain-containing protein n=1 Tax=Scytonema hofmannii PCC 7110 TaxID=128403 RepID=A0A139X1F8_9CYAN|nr:hypothetical protein [Scytonema hofmannii]KYC38462.1 hypothetical protein WA1_35285 [Scytonema hofmannii PCC 7110]